MLLFYIAAADLYSQKSADLARQSNAVRLALWGKNGDFFHAIANADKFGIVCTPGVKWDGITCRKGKVEEIIYENPSKDLSTDLNYMEMGFVPSSVRRIRINQTPLKIPLQTRLLPKSLVTADISWNRIFGTLEVSYLPTEIYSFNVSHNHISGPLYLHHFPHKLRYLDVSYNRIRDRVLYCDVLPESIEQINLYKNKIHCVQPIDGFSEIDVYRLPGLESYSKSA